MRQLYCLPCSFATLACSFVETQLVPETNTMRTVAYLKPIKSAGSQHLDSIKMSYVVPARINSIAFDRVNPERMNRWDIVDSITMNIGIEIVLIMLQMTTGISKRKKPRITTAF